MIMRKLCWGIIVCLSLVVWGCASQPGAQFESGLAAMSGKKVLVATQETKFKQAVVSKIYDQLNQNSIYSRIVNVSRLKYLSADEYAAIVIINHCLAGRPDPRVESFIDNHSQTNKIIMVTTGIGESWKPDVPGVDAITSASVMDQTDQVAGTIVNRVLALVHSKNPKP